jgi:putative membrane protein
MQQLAPMSGHPFDMVYMRDNVTGHEQAIRGVEQELQQTHNPAIRGLIMGGLPILEQHLALAEAVDNAIGGSGGAQAMNQAG